MVKMLVFDTETSGLPDVKPWEIPSSIPILFDRNRKIITNFKTNQQLSKLSPEEVRDYRNKKKQDDNTFNQSLHSNYDTSIDMWKTFLNKWPHIVQLSYILYDTETNETKIYDSYIDLPETIKIDPKSSLVTHIYKIAADIPSQINPETCIILSNPNIKKICIKECLDEFIKDMTQCDIVVGHNIQFDRNVVIAEMIRNNAIPEDISLIMDSSNIKFICTMKESTMLCMLPAVKEYVDRNPVFYEADSSKPETVKYPKLNEAYFKVFNYLPSESSLHNSIYDVVTTLRIFCMLGIVLPVFDIYGKNNEIDKLLDDITIDTENRRCFCLPIPNICTNLNKKKRRKRSNKNSKHRRK